MSFDPEDIIPQDFGYQPVEYLYTESCNHQDHEIQAPTREVPPPPFPETGSEVVLDDGSTIFFGPSASNGGWSEAQAATKQPQLIDGVEFRAYGCNPLPEQRFFSAEALRDEPVPTYSSTNGKHFIREYIGLGDAHRIQVNRALQELGLLHVSEQVSSDIYGNLGTASVPLLPANYEQLQAVRAIEKAVEAAMCKVEIFTGSTPFNSFEEAQAAVLATVQPMDVIRVAVETALFDPKIYDPLQPLLEQPEVAFRGRNIRFDGLTTLGEAQAAQTAAPAQDYRDELTILGE